MNNVLWSEVTVGAKPGADGSNRERSCTVGSCPNPTVISFVQQELCINHFVSRCYEGLWHLDLRGKPPAGNDPAGDDMDPFIDECCQKTFEVSFRCDHLDNLQRGQLLDILLWAEELRARRSQALMGCDSGTLMREKGGWHLGICLPKRSSK